MRQRATFCLVAFAIKTLSDIIANRVNKQSSSTRGILFAHAKGVAGLGKAGGDGQAGTDKGGQQVPPEVYIALTYAGTAFLFTLSVPLILYGLNKLLNKIEDCLGCGSSKKRAELEGKKDQSQSYLSPHSGHNLSTTNQPNDNQPNHSVTQQLQLNQQYLTQSNVSDRQARPNSYPEQMPFSNVTNNLDSTISFDANNESNPRFDDLQKTNSQHTSRVPSPEKTSNFALNPIEPFDVASPQSNVSSHKHPNLHTIQLKQQQHPKQQAFFIS